MPGKKKVRGIKKPRNAADAETPRPVKVGKPKITKPRGGGTTGFNIPGSREGRSPLF